MRIDIEILHFLRERLKKVSPEARLFLFGSRTDDAKKGGDIDILFLTAQKVERGAIFEVKLAFYKQFGEQKLDIVNFAFSDESPFKQLALLEGTEFT